MTFLAEPLHSLSLKKETKAKVLGSIPPVGAGWVGEVGTATTGEEWTPPIREVRRRMAEKMGKCIVELDEVWLNWQWVVRVRCGY